MKQGEVEKVLREIAKGCSVRRGAQSQLVRLHVELLSIILDESNEQFVFFQTLQEYIYENQNNHFILLSMNLNFFSYINQNLKNILDICGLLRYIVLACY